MVGGPKLPLVVCPLLTADAVDRIALYLRAHAPDVAFNPVQRPVHPLWHGALQDHDPFESIASVRRAAVGHAMVRVHVLDVGFRAAVEDARTGTIRRSGEIRPTLAAAIGDAIGMIHEELDSGSPT